MLSGWSNYLFGGDVPSQDTAATDEHSDWVFIDNPDNSDVGLDAVTVCSDFHPESEPPASDSSPPHSMSSTPAMSDAGALNVSISAGSSDEPSSDFECFRGPYVNTRDLLLQDRPINGEPAALSDVSSQPEHLGHPSVDECWLVTPPPCFVGSSQQPITAGPLEDLLIEHPSMSVYSQRLMETSTSSVDFSPTRQQSFSRSASAGALPPQPLPHVIPRRTARLNHIINSVSTVRPSSWNGPGARLRCENSRSFLDRKNLIRAAVGHGHGYRRSERMTVMRSGMNNSRHCQ